MEGVNDAADRYCLGPEELVRRETKLVNALRVLLMAVLIVTAVLLSFGSFKLTSKWEEEAYKRNFDVISVQFKSSFHAAMAQLMWNAYIIGVTASASADIGNVTPNITIPMFDKIPLAVSALSHVTNIFFAPLLRSENELRGWESYAQQVLNETASIKTVCNPCGNPNLEIGSPTVMVDLPVGSFACRKFYFLLYLDQYSSALKLAA